MPEQHAEATRKFFDQRIYKNPSFLDAPDPCDCYPSSHEYARRLSVGAATGLILEVGCGKGEDSIRLAQNGHRVIAVDIAGERLRVARSMAGNGSANVQFVQMDAQQLALADSSVDLVYGNSILLFLDALRFLAECRRVLRPGGRLLLSHESMRDHPLLYLYRLRPKLLERESIIRRLRFSDIGTFQRYFRAVSHRQFYLLAAFLYPLMKRFGRRRAVQIVYRFLVRLDDFLLERLPVLRRLAWVSVIQGTR